MYTYIIIIFLLGNYVKKKKKKDFAWELSRKYTLTFQRMTEFNSFKSNFFILIL